MKPANIDRAPTLRYTVVYDGNCNLCSNLVQLLETLDRGQQFQYIPMQDSEGLATYGVAPADCEQGMILIHPIDLNQRWQGSAAAEEIGRLLPLGAIFVAAYRGIPGMKGLGDRAYLQIRDHRYDWFGRRQQTYRSRYPACDNSCERYFADSPSSLQ
ncbi:thiol-disulfide oxidoreductase DCC family protein [Alkalinema pantanalense CENA528]|uniref:thiol-disulfide oxidoreductase DCC family protein n=1 Tax=Alkalinema pantanalense TaxID=1620705 RepID=UPI003D6E6F83